MSRSRSRADAAALRDLLERRQVTPDGWPGMDTAGRLRWLVENTAQVLHPRPPVMHFRARARGGLEGPSFVEGPEAERVEAERADLFERLRHEAAAEVAAALAADPPSAEAGREAAALLALLGQAAEARAAGRPRAELVSHVERLLGGLAARLLRPDADLSRRARRLLREGRAAENRRRAGEAAGRDARLAGLVRARLRARPEARNTELAAWLRRGGESSLSLNSLRQLVGRLRRGMAGES